MINFRLTFLYCSSGIISPPDLSSFNNGIAQPDRPSTFSWGCPQESEWATEIHSRSVVVGDTDWGSETRAEPSGRIINGRISKTASHGILENSAALDEKSSQRHTTLLDCTKCDCRCVQMIWWSNQWHKSFNSCLLLDADPQEWLHSWARLHDELGIVPRIVIFLLQ